MIEAQRLMAECFVYTTGLFSGLRQEHECDLGGLYGKFFGLLNDFWASTAGLLFDESCGADLGQGCDERAHGSGKAKGASAAQEDTSKQQAEHGDEGVNLKFLICPVELRAEGGHPGILEIAESAFDFALAPVGFDDLGGGPFLARGGQQAQAEVVSLQEFALGGVNEGFQAEAMRALMDAAGKDLAQILAVDDPLDLAFYSGFAIAGMRGDPGDPGEGLGELLIETPALAGGE